MNKTLIMVITAILVILIAGVTYFWWQNKNSTNKLPVGNNNTAVNVTGNMPETNPFKTKVNPMEGYTNPFAK